MCTDLWRVAYFSKHTLQRAYFFSDFSVATCLASCLIFWAFQCRRAYKDVLIKKMSVHTFFFN